MRQKPHIIRLILAAMILSAVLTACTTAPKPRTPPSTKAIGNESSRTKMVGSAIKETSRSIPSAATAPLQDLNLVREGIPTALENIESPYKIITPVNCTAIKQEVEALDKVLGKSLDHFPQNNSNSTSKPLSSKAAKSATKAAKSAIKSAATSWIPYRSVLRRISGAKTYQDGVDAAYNRGLIRRAFLKGLGYSHDCPFPARPAERPPQKEQSGSDASITNSASETKPSD